MDRTGQVQHLIGSWTENLDTALHQKPILKCPACSVEWTKLNPCQYINDDGETVISYLCVVCSETLVSWDWLFNQSGIPGAESEVRYSRPRYMRVQVGDRVEQYDQPKNAYVVVRYGSMSFVATSNGTGGPILFKEKSDSDSSYASNIYALRSKIMWRIKNPIEIERERVEQVESMVRRKR